MVQLKSKSGTPGIVFNKENNYETTLIAYDIVRIEAKNSKIIPVSNVLLPRVQELKDEYGNVTGSVIKKPTYKLEIKEALYYILIKESLFSKFKEFEVYSNDEKALKRYNDLIK